MEDVIKRQMPNSIEAEQSVIGSMIVDRDVIMECAEILNLASLDNLRDA